MYVAFYNGCFWNDSSIALFSKTGQQVTNTTEIFIPNDEKITGRKYVSPNEWNNLSYEEILENKYWTASPNILPLIGKGIIDFEFQWAKSVGQQEAQLLQSNVNVRRARDINEQLFGSIDLRHIVIRT